jgi:hypothetical protein
VCEQLIFRNKLITQYFGFIHLKILLFFPLLKIPILFILIQNDIKYVTYILFQAPYNSLSYRITYDEDAQRIFNINNLGNITVQQSLLVEPLNQYKVNISIL